MAGYPLNRTELSLIQSESNWTMAARAFGTEGVPANVQVNVRNLIKAEINRMFQLGGIDAQVYNWMNRGADAGYFVYPSLTSQMSADPLMKTAWYAMMDRTGLWGVRSEVMNKIGAAVSKTAIENARKQAYWETMYNAARWVSGKAVLDKIESDLKKIAAQVEKLRLYLNAARKDLPPEKYQILAQKAQPINNWLTKLEDLVPGYQEDVGGGLGVLTLGVAIIAGVVAAVVAVALVIIVGMVKDILTSGAKLYSEEQDKLWKQRQEKLAANDAWLKRSLASATTQKEKLALEKEYAKNRDEIELWYEEAKAGIKRPDDAANKLIKLALVGTALVVGVGVVLPRILEAAQQKK